MSKVTLNLLQTLSAQTIGIEDDLTTGFANSTLLGAMIKRGEVISNGEEFSITPRGKMAMLILSTLSNQSSTSTKVLAKKVRETFPETPRKEVNSILYSYLKIGYLSKEANEDGSDPKWKCI